MKKVFITGATGVVGGHLKRHLTEAGYQVFSATRDELGDPFSVESWRKTLESAKCQTVVHLIAKTHAADAADLSALPSYRRVNVDITKALLQASRDVGIKKFVYLSSIKAVGEETPRDTPFTEESLCHPEDCYGITKREAEELVLEYTNMMNTIILRPPLIYGPGVKGNFPKLLNAVKKGIPLPFASVRNARSLLFVGNLTHAIECLLAQSPAGGGVFHVADREAPSTPELIRTMATVLKIKLRMPPFSPPLLEALASAVGKRDTVKKLTRSLVVSSQKIVAESSFLHPFSLNAGISVTIHTSFS